MHRIHARDRSSYNLYPLTGGEVLQRGLFEKFQIRHPTKFILPARYFPSLGRCDELKRQGFVRHDSSDDYNHRRADYCHFSSHAVSHATGLVRLDPRYPRRFWVLFPPLAISKNSRSLVVTVNHWISLSNGNLTARTDAGWYHACISISYRWPRRVRNNSRWYGMSGIPAPLC